MPRVDSKGEELYAIKGLPPSLLALPPGCNFNPRCPYRRESVREYRPPKRSPRTTADCFFWKEVARG